MSFVDVFEKTIDQHISKYENLSALAYERCWFKEQEQYSCVVTALKELRDELI